MGSKAGYGWRRINFGEPVEARLTIRVYRAKRPPKPKSPAPPEKIRSGDANHRYAGIKACRLHLIDLARAHGFDRITPGTGMITEDDIMGGDR
jgi:hypothetical protein